MRLAFAGQRVHQPVRRRLADEVGGEVGGARPLEAVAGDGEDHPAVARPAHVRERSLREPQRRLDVHVPKQLPRLGLGLLDAGEPGEARVADEHIEPSMCAHGRRDD